MSPGMFNGMFEGLVMFFVGVGILIGAALVGLFFLIRWVVLHLQWVN